MIELEFLINSMIYMCATTATLLVHVKSVCATLKKSNTFSFLKLLLTVKVSCFKKTQVKAIRHIFTYFVTLTHTRQCLCVYASIHLIKASRRRNKFTLLPLYRSLACRTFPQLNIKSTNTTFPLFFIY